METKDNQVKMRKRNMKIFPIYKALAWDYLFFYTIDFLFFTQIKHISVANVILKESFYAFFSVILQIPANIIIEFLGRRNSIILGNILNCLYIVVIMISKSFGDLVFAEFICAMAFSIKDISQPSLLNESIPPSKNRSSIYSKINSKGASRYYFLNAMSKIISGFLFTINGYLPLACSLSVLIFVTILSIGFIEPINKKTSFKNRKLVKKEVKEITDGFAFVFKSERLKALILCTALIASLYSIFNNYSISLLEDLNISSGEIGIVGALASLISYYASKMQEPFHKKFHNKSLMIIAILLSLSTLLAGIYGFLSQQYIIFSWIIVLAYLVGGFCNGMHSTIIEKYLSNFANHKIDTKIFAAKNFIKNMSKIFSGLFASFLIDKVSAMYGLIIMGVSFTIMYFLLGKYMKTRVGLKPEEYSKIERKYDEIISQR